MTGTMPAAYRGRMSVIVLWDGRGSLVRFVDGLPAWPFHGVPPGLVTRRQLRARGLCPGGQVPYGLIVWRRGRRWARLFRADLARPKRVPSPAQVAALEKAMRVRRTCRECGRDVGYCVPTSTRQCWECFLADEEEEVA